jgi:hypothetical protein
MKPYALQRRYGHAAALPDYPVKDSSGATVLDAFRTLAADIGSGDTPMAADFSDAPEVIHFRGHVLGRRDCLIAIDNWEEAVKGQLGRRLKFKHWREFSPLGFWRYFSVNKTADAIAILEEETYGGVGITNRARWALKPKEEGES